LIKRLKDQTGYSLVEVMVAIMILAIAIIPMVGMFDAGLQLASSSGNYDKARALANTQLEEAKSLPYDTVRDTFPNGTPAPNPTVTSSLIDAPAEAKLPAGSKYQVTKRYVAISLADSPSDKGLMKLTVTVTWGSNDYSTTGVVSE
jgi:prepilin-type N-terminal cleavage/methylation domain-containing protein